MAKIDKPVITPNLGTLHLAHSKPNQPFLLNFVVKPVRMALFSNIIHRSTNSYLKPIIQAIHLLLSGLDKLMKSFNLIWSKTWSYTQAKGKYERNQTYFDTASQYWLIFRPLFLSHFLIIPIPNHLEYVYPFKCYFQSALP